MIIYSQYDDTYGMPMSERDFERLISDETEYHYDWIDGIVYNITCPTPEHSIITSNIQSILYKQREKSVPFHVYQRSYVLIPDTQPLLPDLVLTCNSVDWDKDKRLTPFRVHCPRLIVEVLSPGTERFDRTEKFARYKLCPTLEVYIMVSQDELHVEVYRRITDWQQELSSAGHTIHLDQLDLALPLDAIYEGVLS